MVWGIIKSQIKVPAADWWAYKLILTTSCVPTTCKRKSNPHRALVSKTLWISLLGSLSSRSNQITESSYTDAITLGIVFHYVNSREIWKGLIVWVPQSYVLKNIKISMIARYQDICHEQMGLQGNGNETFWVNQSQES